MVVEAPGLGLQVKWDRGTRVYVKLTSMWNGKVQGLCGNFNGDAQDDLKTPSSGIETSAVIFGDSWKLQDFCASEFHYFDESHKIYLLSVCPITTRTDRANRYMRRTSTTEDMGPKTMWNFEDRCIPTVPLGSSGRHVHEAMYL